MSDDNTYRLGYDKNGDPVTFYPDGCYAARHATTAILRRLNKQHAEITRLRERCEALEKRVERFRCVKCGHDTFVGKVQVEMKKEPDHAD